MTSLTQDQYLEIRNILIHIGGQPQPSKLERLKIAFKDDINSKRVFEKINTFNYLFKILEKRDVLSPEHWDSLNLIIRVVAPDNYEIRNVLQPQSSFGFLRQYWPANMPNDNIRVLPPVPSGPIQQINQMIKDDIGLKWKEFARAFSIPEGYIESLDRQYERDIPRITHEILRRHQENCGNNYERWRADLQKALVSARRRDLAENIDEILAQNPLRA